MSYAVRAEIISCIVLLLAIYGVFCFFTYKNKKQFIFPATLLTFSLIYMILFLPWSQPDSIAHYQAAYRYSNLVMGYGGDMEWYYREEDAAYFNEVWAQFATNGMIVNLNPHLYSYELVLKHAGLLCKATDMMENAVQPEVMKFYSILSYLPQVVGLCIGRLLHLNVILTVYLARLCILFTYVAALSRAVRRTPAGKSVIAAIALFPLSLMMASSFSYDAMVIISTLSFVVSILCLCDNPRSKRNMAEAVFWIFVIGGVKGGGYLILLPLVFMLYQKEERKRSFLQMAAVCGAGLLSLVLFDLVLPAGMTLFQFGEEGGGNLTSAFALQQPLTYLKMCLRVYRSLGIHYVKEAIGSSLAWLEYQPLLGNVAMLLLIIVCLAFVLEKDRFILKLREKCILALVIVIGLFTTPIMLLKDTPMDSLVIVGLQGRYFLPLAPLAFLMLPRPVVLLNRLGQKQTKIVQRILYIGFIALSCGEIAYLLRLYLRR